MEDHAGVETAVPVVPLCRIEGCGEDSVTLAQRGPWSRLCETHKQEERVKQSLRSGGTGVPTRAPRDGDRVVAKTGLAGLARALVPAAADLEKRLAVKDAAKQEATASLARFKASLDELVAATRELITGA